MGSFLSKGFVVALPAPYPVEAGEGLQIGDLFGIAQTKGKAGESVFVCLSGELDIRCRLDENWRIGQPVYWDPAERVATTVAGKYKRIGTVAIDTLTALPTGTGRVCLSTCLSSFDAKKNA